MRFWKDMSENARQEESVRKLLTVPESKYFFFLIGNHYMCENFDYIWSKCSSSNQYQLIKAIFKELMSKVESYLHSVMFMSTNKVEINFWSLESKQWLNYATKEILKIVQASLVSVGYYFHKSFRFWKKSRFENSRWAADNIRITNCGRLSLSLEAWTYTREANWGCKTIGAAILFPKLFSKLQCI